MTDRDAPGGLAAWRRLKGRSRLLARCWQVLREPTYRALEACAPRGMTMRLPTGDRLRLNPRFLGWRLEAYEPEVMSTVAAALKPGSVFVDVGAHVGLYSLLASRCVGAAGQVVAVEPSPANFELLRRHLAWNGCRNVVTVMAAAADRAGRARFTFRPRATDPGACANSLAYRIEDGVEAEVALVTLDELCRSRSPDLVKIDVEGAEWLALRGAERLLTERRTVLVCAMHPEPLAALGGSTGALVAWMRERGYAAASLDGRPVVTPGFEEVVFTPMDPDG